MSTQKEHPGIDSRLEVRYFGVMETEETLVVSQEPESDGEDQALRRRVVALARQRFLAQGFSSVRTEDLAKELGISKKTLYRLFESKNQLVMEVARSLTGDIEEQLQPVFEGDLPFPAKFQRLLKGIAHNVGSMSGHFLTDLGRHAPEVWAEIDRFRRERILGRLKGVIDQGIAEGYVHPSVNSELFVTVVYSVAQNVFTPERLMQLGIGPRDVISFVLRLFSLGILSEKGRNYLKEEQTDDG